MEYVVNRLPRSVINTTLNALDVGGTVTFSRKELPPAYRSYPAKLAREFSRKTGKTMRTLSTKRGVMFVRIYDTA